MQSSLKHTMYDSIYSDFHRKDLNLFFKGSLLFFLSSFFFFFWYKVAELKWLSSSSSRTTNIAKNKHVLNTADLVRAYWNLNRHGISGQLLSQPCTINFLMQGSLHFNARDGKFQGLNIMICIAYTCVLV